MRIVETAEGRDVLMRQSWLNDVGRCMEYGRRAIEDGGSIHNEYTGMGTGLHAGIEAAARGEATTPRAVADVAVAAFDALPITYVDEGGPEEAHKWLEHWCTLLRHQPDVRDVIEAPNVLIEEGFEITVGSRVEPDGSRTSLKWEGHWDACLKADAEWYTPEPRLLDWKTTSRKFNEWEQQRWNIQSTVYTEAAKQLGLLPSPSLFRLVVFYRNEKKPVETVDIWRDASWTGFLVEKCWRYVDLWDAGLATWPLNDQHSLCSERWCPHWRNCKGSYMPQDWHVTLTKKRREAT